MKSCWGNNQERARTSRSTSNQLSASGSKIKRHGQDELLRIDDPIGDLEDIGNQIHAAGGKQTRGYSIDQNRTSQPAPMITAGKVYKVYLTFMTKEVIPDGRGKSYKELCDIIKNYKEHEYDLPLAREAMQMALTQELTTRKGQADGELLFPSTYTICKDSVDKGKQRIVGKFDSHGLFVNNNFIRDKKAIGAAALRRLFLGYCKSLEPNTKLL